MTKHVSSERITIMKREIDVSSPIPVYHQIANDIKLLFAIERWPIGSKIPSEQSLAVAYGVSRVTLRQALAELEKEGFITKINGVGSVLATSPEPVSQALYLPGFSESKNPNMPKSNFQAKVLTLEMCGPSNSINSYLALSNNQSLIHVKRLFLHEGKPVALNQSWLSPQSVPAILEKGLVENSMSKTLLSYGHKVNSISNTIEPINCTAIEMKLLEIGYNVPVIMVSSLSFLQSEEPLEFSKTIWRGDRIKFKVNVNREDSILTQ